MADEGSLTESQNDSVEPKVDDFERILKNLLNHFVTRNLSLKCLEDTAKLMNDMPGATIKLPTTKYKLLQAFFSITKFTVEHHVFCGCCKIFSKCIVDRAEWKCVKCSVRLHATEINHFTYIPLEQQLKYVLDKHMESIEGYLNGIEINCSGPVTDVYSGSVVRRVMQAKDNMLCLMLNTDGVAVKKSSKNSLWPIQIICNFLPPHLRYRLENVLCVGFHYSNEKPDMLCFFRPFAEELKRLETDGFVFRDRVYRVAATNAALDLPAKSMFLQIKQFNGYSACGFCFEKGELIQGRKNPNYVNRNETVRLRTHDDFVKAMNKIITEKPIGNIEDGVQGICPAVTFEYFDLVKSFCLDYMHNTLLGVTKRMIEFWLNPSHEHPSLISKTSRKVLNRRIASIKPPRFISRLPRSLEQRKMFKASEYRSMLLYWLPVCLHGILGKKYLDHFKLLSACIYKLLNTEITDQDKAVAGHHLNLFVKQYEEIYGSESMTMNVHMVGHILFCVDNLGPLWAQSMFSFESNNAVFSRYVTGNTDVLAQITTKYVLHKSTQLRRPPIHPTENPSTLKIPKVISPNVADLNAMCARGIVFEHISAVHICCVYENSTDRFTSICYSQANKTIDYFVYLRNDSFGKVKYYFEHENIYYAAIESFELVDHVNHIAEIQPIDEVLICFAEEIDRKMIYINFGLKHYMTERPNPFESD